MFISGKNAALFCPTRNSGWRSYYINKFHHVLGPIPGLTRRLTIGVEINKPIDVRGSFCSPEAVHLFNF